MFKNNKYTKWYYEIINNATSQNRIKLDKNNLNYKYYEKHHIIPKSLGGNNLQSNLVLLTGREHYICHLLLIKMVDTFQFIKKMERALSRFCSNTDDRKLTNRQYEIAKIAASKCKKGITFTNERNRKISNTMKEKWANDIEYRNNVISSLMLVNNTSEYKSKHSKIMLQSYKNPNRKKRLQKLIKKKTYIMIYHPIKNIYKYISRNQEHPYKKIGYIKVGSG